MTVIYDHSSSNEIVCKSKDIFVCEEKESDLCLYVHFRHYLRSHCFEVSVRPSVCLVSIFNRDGQELS